MGDNKKGKKKKFSFLQIKLQRERVVVLVNTESDFPPNNKYTKWSTCVTERAVPW